QRGGGEGLGVKDGDRGIGVVDEEDPLPNRVVDHPARGTKLTGAIASPTDTRRGGERAVTGVDNQEPVPVGVAHVERAVGRGGKPGRGGRRRKVARAGERLTGQRREPSQREGAVRTYLHLAQLEVCPPILAVEIDEVGRAVAVHEATLRLPSKRRSNRKTPSHRSRPGRTSHREETEEP